MKSKTPDILSAIDGVIAATFAARNERTAAAVERLFKAGVAPNIEGSPICGHLYPTNRCDENGEWVPLLGPIQGILNGGPNWRELLGSGWGPLEGLTVSYNNHCSDPDCEACNSSLDEGPYAQDHFGDLDNIGAAQHTAVNNQSVLFYPPDGVEPSGPAQAELRSAFQAQAEKRAQTFAWWAQDLYPSDDPDKLDKRQAFRRLMRPAESEPRAYEITTSAVIEMEMEMAE